jgi:hypothetical protein
LIILALFSVIAGADPGTANKSIAATAGNNSLAKATLEDLATEFRRLRKIQGHFEGGRWNDEVDKWMGRKHRLMLELGSRLGKGEYQKSEIIKLLDPPDQVVRRGDNLFSSIISIPGYEAYGRSPYEFLVYYWRGKHDFLFFICRDEVVINSGWWYAGD